MKQQMSDRAAASSSAVSSAKKRRLNALHQKLGSRSQGAPLPLLPCGHTNMRAVSLQSTCNG